MKPNELMDGNWIITKPNAPFAQNHIMEVNAHAIANFSEHYNGVPLSEDWLIKLGFEKILDRPVGDEDYSKTYELEHIDYSGYNVFYKIGDFWLAGLRNDDTCWDLVYENAGYDEEAHIYTHVAEITTVHRLQNLYYEVTGKHLTPRS